MIAHADHHRTIVLVATMRPGGLRTALLGGRLRFVARSLGSLVALAWGLGLAALAVLARFLGLAAALTAPTPRLGVDFFLVVALDRRRIAGRL